MSQLNVSTSFYKFLDDSESRLAQFILRAINYAGTSKNGYWYHDLMVTTAEINYLTMRDDGTISYLPKNKEHVVNEDGRWARDGRQNGSASRVIRKVLTKNALKLFKDIDFENFTNQYKSSCDEGQKRFEILPNIEIPNVYNMRREGGGCTLNDSCMNNKGKYMELYKYCPHVRMLCMFNKEDELAGRALLWTLDDGKVLCDRIYVAKDHYYDLFLDYIDKNDFIRKRNFKSMHDKDEFVYKGETFHEDYRISTRTDLSYYPYVDTFAYAGDGFITNECGGSGVIFEMTCTDGSYEGQNDDEDNDDVYCEVSGCYYHQDDCYYIERGRYNGSYLHADHVVYCESDGYYYYSEDDDIVELHNRYYRKDDDDIVEIDGDYYHRDKDNVEWSDFHDEYVFTDDCVYSQHHESWIRNDEAYKVGNDFFHESIVNKVA